MGRTLGKKLIEIKSHCGLDSNLEETDFSGAILPNLPEAEPDVEKDSKNLKESGYLIDPNHDHTTAKKPEHVDNSSDCDEVNKTKVDNGFPTLSREVCKKKVKKRRVLRLSALKHRKRCTSKKEARGSAPSAQNSASRRGGPAKNRACRIIQQKRGKKEIGESMSPHIVSCAQSPSTSSRNSAGRVKMLCRVYSSSGSSCSSICCSPSDLDPIDERHEHKLLGSKSQKKQNEFIDDLQICKTPYSNNPEGICLKTNENEGKSKSIREAFKSDQSLVLNTSSETSVGTTRRLRRADSSSASVSSLICSRSKMDRVIKRNRHKLLAANSRKKINELKEDLHISKNRYSQNLKGVQQKTDKNVEKSKSISAETARDTQSTIPSTSRGNSERITRMCRRVDRTSTFASSNNCSSSELNPELETCAGRKRMLCHENTPSTSSRTDDGVKAAQLIKQEKHKLWDRKCRKEESELMEELRLLIPHLLNIPKASKALILILAREYIRKLKENLETHEKTVEDMRNENKSLEQEFKNLMTK